MKLDEILKCEDSINNILYVAIGNDEYLESDSCIISNVNFIFANMFNDVIDMFL